MQSPSAGSESDDEMSLNPQQTPVLEPSSNHRGFPNRERSESSYGGSAVASSPVEPKSPGPRMLSQSSLPKQSTKSGRPAQAPTSDQFNSPTTHARPPPPPPPPQNNQGSDRRMTAESLKERTGTSMSEGETEYDGDYDTDIASRASHKDALTKKDSERGIDESQNAGDVDLKASNRQSRIAPIQATQHTESRTRPPPIPSTHPVRQSMEFTRPPPPPPPPQQTTPLQPPSSFGSQGFDTVEVTTPSRQAPQLPKDHYPAAENTGTYFNDEDLYGAPIVTPAYTRVPPPPLPPPLSSPPQHTPHLNPASNPASSPHILRSLPVAESSETWGQSRQSQETSRSSHATTRASVDISRSAYDHGYMASDVDLISGGPWWTAADTFPPVFQNRRDVRIEMQEQSIANRDTNDAATKVVHVLFPDYSQTIVTAQYDTKGVGEPVVQQRHEPPPAKPRQDQLEEAYEKFGRHVSGMVVSKQNLTIGDGTAQALVHDIIKTFPSALPPIGTRAYGATVYANIANATVQQYDEIRPGDIITLRNVRLQGKHGPMHQKYSLEVGKPDHVGIVVDWDGTKKKIRAWEQGRDGKKVKIESYKLGDLRSGEVRVWRVMDRQWVGWTAT